MRSFGVERSLKHACVGNEAAMSPTIAKASAEEHNQTLFTQRKKKRIFIEGKIRTELSAWRWDAPGSILVALACFCWSAKGPACYSRRRCPCCGEPLWSGCQGGQQVVQVACGAGSEQGAASRQRCPLDNSRATPRARANSGPAPVRCRDSPHPAPCLTLCLPFLRDSVAKVWLQTLSVCAWAPGSGENTKGQTQTPVWPWRQTSTGRDLSAPCQPSPFYHWALNVGPWVLAAVGRAFAGDAQGSGSKSILTWVPQHQQGLGCHLSGVTLGDLHSGGGCWWDAGWCVVPPGPKSKGTIKQHQFVGRRRKELKNWAGICCFVPHCVVLAFAVSG